MPDTSQKDILVQEMASAQKRIWIEIYTWTEKDTLSAVIDAYHRWVDVRVILEWNVYGTPRINDPTHTALTQAGIPVMYSDNSRYNFTHAKFWLIDDVYCISTWNLTYSSFQKNRDIILCNSESQILWILSDIFEADILHEWPMFWSKIPKNIGISPINMRSRLMTFLDGAQNRIRIYVQTLSDPQILELLEKQSEKGINIEVCLAENDSNMYFTWYTFPISFVKKPYLHAKVIFVDTGSIMIWSVNLTENAIDHNREIALFYAENPFLFQKIEKLYLSDCFD